MSIKNYKGKDTYTTLGLRRGKAAIRREASSRTRRRIFVWIGLIGLVAFVNYLFVVHLGPLGKKGAKLRLALKGHEPSDPLVDWFIRANRRFQGGDLEGAAEAYTHAIALKQEEARSYNNRGIVYLTVGEHDKAIDDYTRAIALNPDYAEALTEGGLTSVRDF